MILLQPNPTGLRLELVFVPVLAVGLALALDAAAERLARQRCPSARTASAGARRSRAGSRRTTQERRDERVGLAGKESTFISAQPLLPGSLAEMLVVCDECTSARGRT